MNLKDPLLSSTIPEETSNVDNPESFHTLGKYVVTFSLVAIHTTAIQSRSILYSYLAFIRNTISYFMYTHQYYLHTRTGPGLSSACDFK